MLRHELIALHVADEPNGAQSYPQCVNLNVLKAASGSGVEATPGEYAMEFYKADDPGIMIDIHGNVHGYQIPGPKLWAQSRT